MWDFEIGRTVGLMARTAPFIVFRLVVFVGVAVAYVLAIGVGSGAGYLVGRMGSDPAAFGFWGGAFGFGLVSMALYWAREYLLYLVKAGHIAVMVELLDGRELPHGRGQIDYAQGMVRERFTEASVLFGVDQLIKGILSAVNGALFTVAAFLPIPGLAGAMGFINKVLNLSLTYTDEVILAHNFRTRSDNPWASSRTALVLYAQNFKAILKNAFFLLLLTWLLTFLLFLLILAPAAGLAALFGGAGAWVYIIAAVFAWSLKAALVDPFALCAMLQVYFKLTEGQSASPQWEARLAGVSDKFRELGEKARDFVAPRPVSAGAAAPATT
ncbi:MAG TPA: hypothetical protein VM074_12465 [Solimonas sp.]|nr:hypothetical protein [Solimonas sp.]